MNHSRYIRRQDILFGVEKDSFGLYMIYLWRIRVSSKRLIFVNHGQFALKQKQTLYIKNDIDIKIHLQSYNLVYNQSYLILIFLMYFFDINYTLMKIMVHVYLLREKFTYIRVHLISTEMKTTTVWMQKRTKLGIYNGERDSSS